MTTTKPSMVLARCTAHWDKPEETGGWNWERCWQSQDETLSGDYRRYGVVNTPFMQAYQEVSENTSEDLIAYLHDDLSVYSQGWDERVLHEFDDPSVGVVGFFGAFAACNPRLYVEPFSVGNFARAGVISNLRRDAHLVGERYAGCADISQFDGLALVVRRNILEQSGGWPSQTRYYGYDMWLSYEARRLGYRLRYVGIDCDHWSGKTMPFMKTHAQENGLIDPCGDEAHKEEHLWLYEKYRNTGVIPYEVKDQRRAA